VRLRRIVRSLTPRSRTRPPALAVYVSSHGFGHAVRVSDVLAELLVRSPNCRVYVRTLAPEWLFPARVSLERSSTDVGLVQRDSLTIDFAATLEALAELEATCEARVEKEAAWLRAIDASLVLGDIPPIAFAAADRVRVAGIALGNFSWDWIYRAYVTRNDRFAGHADRAAESYAFAKCLLRLPFHADMPAFRSVVDIPLVARRSASSRADVRRRIGLPVARPLVLLSFGGLGLGKLNVAPLGEMADVGFVATEPFADAPPNLTCLPRSQLDYTALLAACDAVITKPGYGIVASSLVNGVRVLYATRDDFPETPILVRALEEHGTAEAVEAADLVRGEIRAPLERLLARPVCESPIAADGAARAAELLVRELGR
jgi:hypothetical protein